jgi:hypothetical protein
MQLQFFKNKTTGQLEKTTGNNLPIFTWEEITEEEYFLQMFLDFKAKKIKELKEKRNNFMYVPIVLSNGYVLKSTKDAMVKFFLEQYKIIVLKTENYPMRWRLINDITFIHLSEDECKEYADKIGIQYKLGYEQESVYREQIENSNTIEELSNINIVFE